MKRLLGLFLSFCLIPTINAQYSKVTNANDTPYFLIVNPGAIRGKPCLRCFYVNTKEPNIPVKIFEYSDSRYKDGKLIDSICTNSSGFKKTKTVQFSDGIHYLKYIAYAHNTEYEQKEKLHIKKGCK